MKKKIKKAILRYLSAIDKTFYGTVLIEYVRDVTGATCYDDTIMRVLRQMRSDGEVRYKFINKRKSIYQKV